MRINKWYACSQRKSPRKLCGSFQIGFCPLFICSDLATRFQIRRRCSRQSGFSDPTSADCRLCRALPSDFVRLCWPMKSASLPLVSPPTHREDEGLEPLRRLLSEAWNRLWRRPCRSERSLRTGNASSQRERRSSVVSWTRLKPARFGFLLTKSFKLDHIMPPMAFFGDTGVGYQGTNFESNARAGGNYVPQTMDSNVRGWPQIVQAVTGIGPFALPAFAGPGGIVYPQRDHNGPFGSARSEGTSHHRGNRYKYYSKNRDRGHPGQLRNSST